MHPFEMATKMCLSKLSIFGITGHGTELAAGIGPKGLIVCSAYMYVFVCAKPTVPTALNDRDDRDQLQL